MKQFVTQFDSGKLTLTLRRGPRLTASPSYPPNTMTAGANGPVLLSPIDNAPMIGASNA